MGTEKKMGFLQVQVPRIWDYTEHDKPCQTQNGAADRRIIACWNRTHL